MRKQIVICLMAVTFPAVLWAEVGGVEPELKELKRQLQEANTAFERAVQEYQASVEDINQRIQALDNESGVTSQVLRAETRQWPADVPGADPESWAPAAPLRIGGGDPLSRG